MDPRRHSLSAFRTAFAATLFAGVAFAQTHDSRALISTDSAGDSADDASMLESVSGDGAYVSFRSGARNLVAHDANGVEDVFVHDRLGGATVRVSVDSNGVEADARSYRSVLSSDGRFVAFVSWATNLVAGDTNGVEDVFLHDRDPDGNGIFDEGNGVTTRVSVDSAGNEGNGPSNEPSISDDGTLVAFGSVASNLVANDTNQQQDIFVHDTTTGITTRESVGNSGAQANGGSMAAAISGNGRFVAFMSSAINLVGNDTNQMADIFRHDRVTGATRRASVDSAGGEADDASGWPVISRDGTRVAFSSAATNLDARRNNSATNVYVHDFQAKTTELADLDSSGVGANDGCTENVALSGDGNFVVFESVATNLDPIASDGNRYVFVRDLQAGATSIISRTCFATGAPGFTTAHAISRDGAIVGFGSDSPDLSTADTNQFLDVFVYDRSIPEPIASSNGYGTGYPGTHGIPKLTSSAAPVFGNAITLTIDNSAGSATTGLLAVGQARASIPTRAGGTLLVAPFIFVVLSIPSNGLSIQWTAPLSPAYCGVQIDMQALELDAGAQYGISFTRGLEWIVGN